MCRRYPKLLIIEHEEKGIKRILRIPLIREIKEKAPESIDSICVEELEDVSEKIRNMVFDIAISDVYFPGTPNVDAWGESLAKELTDRGIPIIVISAHLNQQDIIKIINKYQIAGILEKNKEDKEIDAILRDLLYRKLKKISSPSLSETATWVHISDLHFGPMHEHNRIKVEEAFFEDIKRLRDDGLLFNMIMITGDIAYSGKQNEYKLASEFISKLLDKTGVSNGYLFFVPGNHDLDRTLINPSAQRLCSVKNRDELGSMLGDSPSRNILLKPFEEFDAFLRGLKLGNYLQINDDYSISGIYKELSIGVVGINSALGSGISKKSSGEDNDKGNLFIGEARMESAIDRLGNCDLRVAMMHHPLSYFCDFDANDVEKILVKKCDILLHGHLHISDFKKMGKMKNEIVVIPAGSVYQGRDLVNSYNVATVDLEQRKVVVCYRRYSDMQQEFVKDIDITGEKLDGRLQFSLSTVK